MMKNLHIVFMILSCIAFVLTIVSLLYMDSLPVTILLLVVHSLLLFAYTFFTIRYKDPDLDAQRLHNVLQQTEADYKEYKTNAEKAIAAKDERIQEMSHELEGYIKG